MPTLYNEHTVRITATNQ